MKSRKVVVVMALAVGLVIPLAGCSRQGSNQHVKDVRGRRRDLVSGERDL